MKKDIVLENDGKRYVLGIYKNPFAGNKYTINEIKTLFEFEDSGDNNINLFILRNITNNGYYYANKKSGDFLKRLGISSFDAVRKSTALDLSVPTERRGVKFSMGLTSENNTETHTSVAKEEFGTTYDYRKAGYILDDGSYLDLSEGQSRRTQDHRSVGYLFDEIDYATEGMSAGMIRFMNEGNIRIQPESGGLDISNVVQPTEKQYSKMYDFLENYRDDWHQLDMSDENGKTVFSFEYPPNTSPRRVINDIKQYFEDGTIPEKGESYTDFHYSFGLNGLEDAKDNAGAKLSEEQWKYFVGSKLTDENDNLLRIYHTSPTLFEEFDPTESNHYQFGDKVVNYFSSDPVVSGSYTDDKYIEVTNDIHHKRCNSYTLSRRECYN